MLGNFTYCNPTRLHFGENALDPVSYTHLIIDPECFAWPPEKRPVLKKDKWRLENEKVQNYRHAHCPV